MGECERLVELFARFAALVEVGERFAEASAGERFAADRAGLAAQCRGFEQMRACCLRISGKELDFAEQGGREGLSAEGAAGARVLTPSSPA